MALEGKTFSSIFLFPHLLTRNRPVSLTAEYLHIAFASEKKPNVHIRVHRGAKSCARESCHSAVNNKPVSPRSVPWLPESRCNQIWLWWCIGVIFTVLVWEAGIRLRGKAIKQRKNSSKKITLNKDIRGKIKPFGKMKQAVWLGRCSRREHWVQSWYLAWLCSALALSSPKAAWCCCCCRWDSLQPYKIRWLGM